MSAATTMEIPKDTWKQYFNDLSKTYQGWSVTVELLGAEIGDQHFAAGLMLQGISYDPEGSQAGDVMIEAGDTGMPFHVHLVRKPRAVRVAMTQPGEEADIEIEAEDGVATLVRMRRRPELPSPGGT